LEIDLQRAIERELKGLILCLTHRHSTSLPTLIASIPTSVNGSASSYQINSTLAKRKSGFTFAFPICEPLTVPLKVTLHWPSVEPEQSFPVGIPEPIAENDFSVTRGQASPQGATRKTIAPMSLGLRAWLARAGLSISSPIWSADRNLVPDAGMSV
jgi:hypothetical protein